MSKEQFTIEELEKFKSTQKLAYDAVSAVEKMLHVGITEKEAAAGIEKWLSDRGVKRFFHHGFAWFGDRTRFRNFVRSQGIGFRSLIDPEMAHIGKQFMPSDRPLKKEDAVILDIAPIVGNICVDIGYSCMMGAGTTEFHEARMALQPYREVILQMVRDKKTQKEIYERVNQIIAEQGFENIHSYYPDSVIGHRVGKISWANIPMPTISGFDLQAILYLMGHRLRSAIRPKKNSPPLWNHESNHPCEPGLWAIEPHIGKGDIGVKWEEILVVTEDNAYWLDDNLPHVKYWETHKQGAQVNIPSRSEFQTEQVSL